MIIAVASKYASGTAEVSLYAKLVTHYESKYASNVTKLDALALVFANNALTIEDLQSAEDDEDSFEKVVDEKADSIRLEQLKQKEELESAQKSNANISRELQELSNKLDIQKKRSQAKTLLRDISDCNEQKEEIKTKLNQIIDTSNYCKACKIPAARKLLLYLGIPFVIVLGACLWYGAKPVYSFISKDLEHFNVFIGLLGCGAITLVFSLIY